MITEAPNLASSSRALLLAWLALGLCVGCEESQPEPTGKGTSPNASIKPAPLASGEPELRPELTPKPFDGGVVGIPADSAGRLIIPDAGPPPPTPLRADEALAGDDITFRDSGGLTLAVEWAWDNADKSPSGMAANAEAIETLRDKTTPRMTVDLANAGRMRIGLDSVVFPLPPTTEIRSRLERLGHVVVWPNRRAYRGVPPGGMRALFAERRADATPLIKGKVTAKGKGNKLGFETTKAAVATTFGTLNIEQARVQGTTSGKLFCRFLVELVAADPNSEVCEAGLVPVAAQFSWKPRGGISLSVKSLTRRTDLPVSDMRVPPAGALVKPSELPPQTTGILLTQKDLSAMRRSEGEGISPGPDAPGEGLRAVNHSEGLRYVMLDGVPVAWVEPLSQTYIIGPAKSYYMLGWRDFLGANVTPSSKVALPARVLLGSEEVNPDAGATP
ncbi:MAG: hypothetical protein H6718_07345 [Polyangiaceae bacterium]|nr:hypothetical protein [Myxococcales bacterium]MCB9585195.1 hypothetical protein [Polyangiaceae bacterium]